MNIFKERMKWIVSILISFAIVGVFIYCVIFAKDTALSLRKLKKNDIYSYVEINGMPLVAQVENVYKWKDRYHRLLREDDLVIGDAIDLTYNRKIVFEPEIVKFFEENEMILSIDYPANSNIIVFEVDGMGIVPSSIEMGFYYSPDDCPAWINSEQLISSDCETGKYMEYPMLPDGNGWVPDKSVLNSDDGSFLEGYGLYTERICEKIYYYESWY